MISDAFRIDTFGYSCDHVRDFDDFLFYNTLDNGQGPILIGAHLQGIPLSGGGTTSSAIIQTIPEPGMAALLFIGLGVWRLCGRGRPGGRD